MTRDSKPSVLLVCVAPSSEDLKTLARTIDYCFPRTKPQVRIVDMLAEPTPDVKPNDYIVAFGVAARTSITTALGLSSKGRLLLLPAVSNLHKVRPSRKEEILSTLKGLEDKVLSGNSASKQGSNPTGQCASIKEQAEEVAERLSEDDLRFFRALTKVAEVLNVEAAD